MQCNDLQSLQRLQRPARGLSLHCIARWAYAMQRPATTATTCNDCNDLQRLQRPAGGLEIISQRSLTVCLPPLRRGGAVCLPPIRRGGRGVIGPFNNAGVSKEPRKNKLNNDTCMSLSGWHALRYSEGREYLASKSRPSEYLRACHPGNCSSYSFASPKFLIDCIAGHTHSRIPPGQQHGLYEASPRSDHAFTTGKCQIRFRV